LGKKFNGPALEEVGRPQLEPDEGVLRKNPSLFQVLCGPTLEVRRDGELIPKVLRLLPSRYFHQRQTLLDTVPGQRIELENPPAGILKILAGVTNSVANRVQDPPDVVIGMEDQDRVVIGEAPEEKKQTVKKVVPVREDPVHVRVSGYHFPPLGIHHQVDLAFRKTFPQGAERRSAHEGIPDGRGRYHQETLRRIIS
jgi:hypothetical protein